MFTRSGAHGFISGLLTIILLFIWINLKDQGATMLFGFMPNDGWVAVISLTLSHVLVWTLAKREFGWLIGILGGAMVVTALMQAVQ